MPIASHTIGQDPRTPLPIWSTPREQAFIHELNTKYANRVLHDVGLCICVFDVAEVGEGKVRYGDGFLWYTGESSVVVDESCPVAPVRRF